MGLRLQNVDKTVGREIHLKDISLEFKPGSRNIILGRTLAGKTSLLRIMAGLDRPTSGNLHIDDRDLTGVSVRKRSVAMVYQQFINYPSLTVYKNIASPLKIAGLNQTEIDQRVRKIAAILHIDDLLERLPTELSGGQQQRTAIARALVKEADLLLLDEPLVNLDFKLREELRLELQEIFTRRKAIVVYTTTEPAEALMIGGNIVVIDEGRILQTGPASDVYQNPATLKVADVFSDPPINYLKGVVTADAMRLGHGIDIPLQSHLSSLQEGRYQFGVRANHLFLTRTAEAEIEIRTTVELSEINGSETFIHVKYDNSMLAVQQNGVHSYRIGDPITLFVNPHYLLAYNEDGHLAASPSLQTATGMNVGNAGDDHGVH